jgi:hypothetical protein
VLQEQAQVGQAGRLGGRVGLTEDGVEGRPGPGQAALGVAHAGGQQQRRRPGPRGRHRSLGQLPGLAAEGGGGLVVAVVVRGPAELLEGGRLQPVLAVLDGQLQSPLLVGEGGRVVAQRDQDPAPVQPGAGLQGRVARLGGGGG